MKSLREDEVEDLAVGRGEILCQSETSDMRLSSLTWHGHAMALALWVEKVKRRGWKEWKRRLVSRENERRVALPPLPPNRTGQLCTFSSRSNRPCGFTLDGKLLRTERRTSEEEEKEKERWEMRVLWAQGVLEKWGGFKWKRSGLADTMAPPNTLNQSPTESPRQGQYLAQPYSHFTSTSLTLIWLNLFFLAWFISAPPPPPLPRSPALSLSCATCRVLHQLYVFLPRCHLCQLFNVLAEPSCSTQEKVSKRRF